MSDDRKRFTGFEALGEIGRRLDDIAKAVQTKLAKGEDDTRAFTIETERGPITGVFGFEVRNLADGPGRGRPARAERRPASEPAPSAPQEAGPLVDIFDEGDALVVVLDLPVADAGSLTATVSGQLLNLADAASGRDVTTVTLPRAVAHPAVDVRSTNGIVEVRIRGR